MNLLDSEQIRRLFDELSDELTRRGTRAEVFLVGGPRWLLRTTHVAPHATSMRYFSPKDEVYAAAAVVAARHDLPEDWLNDGVKCSTGIVLSDPSSTSSTSDAGCGQVSALMG